MLYAVVRLCDLRMAVALVEQWQLGSRHAPAIVDNLQAHLGLPAMLVARDCSTWRNARAYAEFETERFLLALIGLDEIEWKVLSCAEETSAV